MSPSPKSRTTRSRKNPAQPSRGWSLKLRLAFTGLVLVLGWIIYLDANLTSNFKHLRWELPSRVYARPLELYAGAPLTAEGLAWELSQLGYTQRATPVRPGDFHRRGNQIQLYTRGFNFADGVEPARQLMATFEPKQLSGLSSVAGQPPALVRLEPLQIGGIYPSHNEDRVLVALDQAPRQLIDALLTTEDRNFRSHWGVSLMAIGRALWADVRAGGLVQGGSTLTQQLIKNLYLSSDRNFFRKINEAVMALLLEAHYSKDTILEAYLNEVYLGQSGSRAIHGFGLASQFYFGQSLENLELQQSALLVALVKGPTFYDPRRHPQRALERRNLVIDLLATAGLISPDEAVKARGKPLGVIEKPSFSGNRYPAYVDLVRRHLSRDYRDEDLRSEGLRIFTTLDPQVQHAAEQSVSDTLNRLAGTPSQGKSLESALVVTGRESGEVLALVGGRDARFAGFNRALDARRQVGSLIKPFVYLGALQHPETYNLMTPLDDSPVSVPQPQGKAWAPQNYDHQNHGQVPLYAALAHSYNLATVRMGLDVGVDVLVSQLRDLGFEGELNAFPSLLLGSAGMTPIEVTALYQVLAASGFASQLRTIREVDAADGQVLSRYPLDVRQAASPQTVHLVDYALQQVVREGTAQRVYDQLPYSLTFAGKTGTTDDGRDSWFAGFTGDYLAVAWVGRDDNQSTRLTGASGALKVWTNLMTRLPLSSFEAVVPEHIVYRWVDVGSQSLSAEGCPGARYMPFIEGSEPTREVDCGLQKIPGQVKNWLQRWF